MLTVWIVWIVFPHKISDAKYLRGYSNTNQLSHTLETDFVFFSLI